MTLLFPVKEVERKEECDADDTAKKRKTHKNAPAEMKSNKPVRRYFNRIEMKYNFQARFALDFVLQQITLSEKVEIQGQLILINCCFGRSH
jgi:hypothetical protein